MHVYWRSEIQIYLPEQATMMPQIEYGTRSRRDAQDWICSFCGAINKAVPKLLFKIPKFTCDCGKERYFDRHTLDFSMADVKVNKTPLVQRILDQGNLDECMANAFSKAMEIMHIIDSLKNNRSPEYFKTCICPSGMYKNYTEEYPLMAGKGDKDDLLDESSLHKLIKMALRLRNKGIELKDNTLHRIGDISFIDGQDYEAMIEEMADGVPLLGTFFTGSSFSDGLEHCEFYIPPSVTDVFLCNMKPEPHADHGGHMVVLIGPAAKDNKQGFHIANSYGYGWSEREVDDDTYIAARGGMGKIPKNALITNVIKLWQPGEVADGPMRLQDEDDSTMRYANLPENVAMYDGGIIEKKLVEEGWVVDEGSGRWKYNLDGRWMFI